MMILIPALVFGAVILAVYVFVGFRRESARRSEMLAKRLEQLDSPAPIEIAETNLLKDESVSQIPQLKELLERTSLLGRLQKLIGQAGMHMKAGTFVLITLFTGTLAASATISITGSGLYACIGFAEGAYLPTAYLRRKRKKRLQKFEEGFPSAIEFFARSLRAGHPFSASLEMLGNEMPEPIASEFRTVFEEQRFGLPIREALIGLAERVPLVDVKFFVTSVLLQRETGGNLGELFDKLSYVIRERFKILKQVRVYTAQGRMSMIFLLALPPGVAVLSFVANRDFLSPLFTDSMGKLLLGAATLSQICGFFVIRKIVRIKV